LSQLPLSSTKVALIYNVKQEASLSRTPDSEPTSTQESLLPTTPDHEHSADFHSSAHPARMNDVYAEWDTLETVNAVRDAIGERYEVLMIEANEGAYQKMAENRPFFAFNIAEGLYGASREAQIPAILEMLRVPYLGSDPLTLSVCLDKSRAKEILAYHDIPTAPFVVMNSESMLRDVPLRFPLIVKPLHEGSSKGIYDACVVREKGALMREVKTILQVYGQPALVEEFLPGREFTVGILGNGGSLRVLPVVEIKFDALPSGVNPIYSYEAKWLWDRSEDPLKIFDCPARLDADLQVAIESICCKAYRTLNCRDWSRIDVRLDRHGVPHIIEINPLPGILPRPEDNSCLPKAARAAGMSYNQLINAVLDIAMERCGVAIRSPHRQNLSTQSLESESSEILQERSGVPFATKRG
jgi:D-alanine-D-alanine ligase